MNRITPVTQKATIRHPHNMLFCCLCGCRGLFTRLLRWPGRGSRVGRGEGEDRRLGYAAVAAAPPAVQISSKYMIYRCFGV
eukprot:3864623-Pleurochrysis_carterae.AAC.4